MPLGTIRCDLSEWDREVGSHPVSEPPANANNEEQQATVAQEPWHDKVLMDAIGYTKGLVAVLDSLSDGFQRRGRELEEARHRLTILQSERRAILEERSGFDSQIAALAAERDGLRTTLEERERELERLRQETLQGQAALEAHTREIQALRAGIAEPARQAEELREVVRSLERQLERAGQLPDRVPSTHVPGDSAAGWDVRSALHEDLASLEELLPQHEQKEDSQIAALAAERDGLRTTLEERERELERLRQETLQGQAALEAHTREIQALRAGMAETVRQAEEIQKVLQGLERERESATHRQAVLEAELEVERRRVRETTTRTSQEQIALREDLADAENLLAEARKDIAAGQGAVGSLRRAADAERARNAVLQEQAQAQAQEVSRLNAAMQAAQALLSEIANALGGTSDATGPAPQTGAEAREWAELEALAQDAGAITHPEQEPRASFQELLETLRDVLRPAEGTANQPVRSAADQDSVRKRAAQIVDQWRRFARERTEPTAPGQSPHEERRPLPVQSEAVKSGRETRREGQRPAPGRDRRLLADEATRSGKEEASPAPASASTARQKTKHRSPQPGATVECMIEASGREAARTLRGEIGRMNTMGLMGAFEERFSEGRQVVVRFVRDGQVVSCLGRVVRVQASAASADSPVFNHLIRFESPFVPSGDDLQTFVG